MKEMHVRLVSLRFDMLLQMELMKSNDVDPLHADETESNVHLMYADDTPHTNAYICKALGSSAKELTIEEFVAITAYPINPIMFNYFWQVILNNHSPHVGRVLLEYFGYEGDMWKQKDKFISMLKRNKIPYRELTSKDDLTAYPTIQDEIAELPHEGAVASSKWLIMEPNDIKNAIMQLKTKNGDAIRKYYIDLEELVRTYISYQSICKEREAQRKITTLEQMLAEIKLQNKRIEDQNNTLLHQNTKQLEELAYMKQQNEELIEQGERELEEHSDTKDQLDDMKDILTAVLPDRAIHPKNTTIQDKFTLLKRVKTIDNNQRTSYYVIRGQKSYTNTTITKFRREFTSVDVLLAFEKTPNSSALFNVAKEEMKKMKKAGEIAIFGNIIALQTITEQELVQRLQMINDSRRIVGQ